MPIYIPNTFDSVGEAVVDGAGGFVLDQVPGADLGVSLEKLRGAYTGAAVRVRRDSDNAEEDIGFDSNNKLDQTALTAFCTGANCFVKTWYDQSSAGLYDLTNSTDLEQPKIYDSSTGVIITDGTPSVRWFDSNVNYLPIPNALLNSGQYFAFQVLNSEIASNSVNSLAFTGSSVGQNWTLFSAAGTNPLYQGTTSPAGNIIIVNSSYVVNANQQIQIYQFLVSTKTTLIYHNLNLGVDTDYLWGYNATFNLRSKFSQKELIIYKTDPGSNRAIIEQNINSRYQIYIPYTYDLQEFDTTGTWTKPANCLMAEVVIVGAGGGGASGSKQSGGSTSQGGSAGAGGSVIYNTFLASSLGATESVTIGGAGGGGAAVTQNDTNGTTGGTGGTSSFGSHCALPGAPGADYNLEGSAIGAWDAGVVRNGSGFLNGRNGARSSVAGTGDGSSGGQQVYVALLNPAPSGGSIAAASTGIGGAGNRLFNQGVVLNTAATASAINTGVKSGDGISNWSANFSVGPIMWGTRNIGTMHYGTSGAGGSASVNPTDGGDAGDSGNYGQGGAGGGACQNGGSHVSGKGGNAGGACIKVLSVCYPS